MKKVNKRKGFTLAELLVVIAILAILVAVAVPVFTSQLDKANETVKEANFRAAQSVAMVEYLNTNQTGKVQYDYTVNEETKNITVEKREADTTPGATDQYHGVVEVGGE